MRFSALPPIASKPTVLLLAVASMLGLAITVPAVQTNSARGAFSGAQDGQIAFVSGRDRTGNSQIFVMGPAGQNPTNISNTDDNDTDASFSANGQKIVFDGDPDIGNDELYIMDANGDNRVRLTNSEKDETEPALSPDGSQIAFTSFVNPGFPEVHLINVDGTNERRLTVGPSQSSDLSPSWSPDGTKIAFVRSVNESSIHVINADGTGDTQLSQIDGKNDFDPDFSPDGSSIAYASDRDGNDELYLMNADGSNQRRLTNDPQADRYPAWSPSGSMIAFERSPEEANPQEITLGNGQIVVVDATGQNSRNLTSEPDDGGRPSWQPLGAGADTTPPVLTGGPIQIAPVFVVTGRSTPPRAVVAKRGASRGTAIRYGLSKSASVKLAIERVSPGVKRKRGGSTRCVKSKRRVAKRKRCTATTLVGWLVRSSGQGERRVPFSGRIGRKALSPGLYRIRAGAVDANANPARHRTSRRFRVLRHR